MNRTSRLLATGLALGLAAVLLVSALPAVAQTDVTTGRIVGQVTDNEGQPLPGVSVEAKNTGTGLTLVQVTDARGLYRIVNVPVGSYAVSANLSGFQKSTRTGITVNLASAITVDLKLQLSSVSEALTVTAEAPVIETTQTASQAIVDNSAIQSLPVSGRNFYDFVLLTPNAQRDRERQNLALSGQRGIATNVTVDGVDFTNAFFGGTTGAGEGRAPLSISQESVREFQVVQSGASAEYGRSGGGFVNVITKSGSNEWHGAVFGYYRPSDWSATLADGTEPRDSKKYNLGASFGGPAIKDRLFFFASYEQQRQDTTIPLSGSVAAAETIILARDPTFPTSGTDYTQTADGDVYFGRLDFQLNDKHRVTARGNYNTYDGINGTYSSTTRSPSSNGIEGLETYSLVGQWNGMFSNNLINDFNAQYVKEDIPRQDKGLGLPEIQVQGGATLGEVAFLPILATQDRITLFDSLTFLIGNHVAKAGVEYNDTGMDQIFKGNWRGVYIFRSSGSGSSAQTALQNLNAGKWDEYREFLGLNGLTSDQAGAYVKGQKEYAVFIQDQWYISPQLTATIGLRYEYQDNPNDAVLDANKVTNPALGLVQPDAKIPDAKNQWSPRLSLAWSPDAKTVVRASYGRYWARFPAILTAQLYTSNGIQGTQYVISGAAVNGPAAGSPNPGWGTSWDPTGTQKLGNLPPGTKLAAPGVFTIDPDFENSHTDQFTLATEREFFGIAFGLDGVYAKGYDLQRMGDLNLTPSSNPAVDCPQLDPNSGVTCYGLNNKTNRPNPNYGRISIYTSDARSEFWAATFKFRKNLANGLRFYGSITTGEDKDSDSNERNYGGIQAEDVGNIEQSFSYADRDIKWRFLANASYDFKIVSWLDGFAGFLFNYQTGRPFSPQAGRDLNLDGNTVDRPTVNGEHFERNSDRYPDFYTLDVRAGVGFNLGPGRLSIMGECYNCTNTGNKTYGSTTYGLGPAPNPTYAVATSVTPYPRQFQAALRYDF